MEQAVFYFQGLQSLDVRQNLASCGQSTNHFIYLPYRFYRFLVT